MTLVVTMTARTGGGEVQAKKMNVVFWKSFWRGLALGPLWKWIDRAVNGDVVVTCDDLGRAVAVTRCDRDNRVLEIIWYAPPND